MLKKMLLCAAFLSLAACSHPSSNAPASPSSGGDGDSGFVADGNGQGSDDSESVGNYSCSPDAIDPRVQVGSSETFVGRFSSPSMILTSGQATYTVSSVASDRKSYQLQTSYSNVVNMPPGVSGLPQTCTQTDWGISCRSDDSSYTSIDSGCSVDGEASPEQNLNGRFTSVSGQVFKAYEISQTSTGKITCDGKDMGTGTSTSVIVMTNEFSALDGSGSCGTALLYFDQRIVGSAGNEISVAHFKLVSHQ